MKQNNTLPIVCFLLCLLMLGIGYHLKNSMEPIEIIKTDTITNTDTIWKDTTITKTKTVLKYVKETSRDTLYLKNGKDTVLTTENKTYQDTLCNEGDSVMLQIAISGVKSSLDSIKADWRKSTQVITNTITVEKYIKEPKKIWDRIHLQPQATFGYDPINKNWGAVIGFGVGIDI